jgi:hypothetical protein
MFSSSFWIVGLTAFEPPKISTVCNALACRRSARYVAVTGVSA